jgi:hypothetical protein
MFYQNRVLLICGTAALCFYLSKQYGFPNTEGFDQTVYQFKAIGLCNFFRNEECFPHDLVDRFTRFNFFRTCVLAGGWISFNLVGRSGVSQPSVLRLRVLTLLFLVLLPQVASPLCRVCPPAAGKQGWGCFSLAGFRILREFSNRAGCPGRRRHLPRPGWGAWVFTSSQCIPRPIAEIRTCTNSVP